jgi:hypothetical protein
MGYLHIENLYRPVAQTILLFRECYALEKIHGTSANITFKHTTNEKESAYVGWIVTFFSGGESYNKFVSLFDQEKLLAAVKDLGIPIDKEITVYGEAYGGSQQGMSHTYGKSLKFIGFDVQVGEVWLSVPDAEDVAKKLGLDFVPYTKISLVKSVSKCIQDTLVLTSVETDLSQIDAERDKPSVQAVRNATRALLANEITQEEFETFKNKPREGVVLRPLVEFTTNNGARVICKHKGDAFKETATPRPVVDPSKMVVLEEANAVANEWVTNERLSHVLDKLPNPYDMKLIPQLISTMVEDVYREGKGEFVESDAVKKAIGKKSVELFKGFLNAQIQK